MQLTIGRQYRVVRRFSALELSFKDGMQQKPVFCTLEAGLLVELVGFWLKAPAMLQLALAGKHYAAFAQDLQERVRSIDFEPANRTALQSVPVWSAPAS